MKIWKDQGRWKTECTFSSRGNTWIGFCKLCKVSGCTIAGKTDAEILALAGEA